MGIAPRTRPPLMEQRLAPSPPPEDDSPVELDQNDFEVERGLPIAGTPRSMQIEDKKSLPHALASKWYFLPLFLLLALFIFLCVHFGSHDHDDDLNRTGHEYHNGIIGFPKSFDSGDEKGWNGGDDDEFTTGKTSTEEETVEEGKNMGEGLFQSPTPSPTVEVGIHIIPKLGDGYGKKQNEDEEDNNDQADGVGKDSETNGVFTVETDKIHYKHKGISKDERDDEDGTGKDKDEDKEGTNDTEEGEESSGSNTSSSLSQCILHGTDHPEFVRYSSTTCNAEYDRVSRTKNYPSVQVHFLDRTYDRDEGSTTFRYNVCASKPTAQDQASGDKQMLIHHVSFGQHNQCCLVRTKYFGTIANFKENVIGGLDDKTCTYGVKFTEPMMQQHGHPISKEYCEVYELIYLGYVPKSFIKVSVHPGWGSDAEGKTKNDQFFMQRITGARCSGKEWQGFDKVPGKDFDIDVAKWTPKGGKDNAAGTLVAPTLIDKDAAVRPEAGDDKNGGNDDGGTDWSGVDEAENYDENGDWTGDIVSGMKKTKEGSDFTNEDEEAVNIGGVSLSVLDNMGIKTVEETKEISETKEFREKKDQENVKTTKEKTEKTAKTEENIQNVETAETTTETTEQETKIERERPVDRPWETVDKQREEEEASLIEVEVGEEEAPPPPPAAAAPPQPQPQQQPPQMPQQQYPEVEVEVKKNPHPALQQQPPRAEIGPAVVGGGGVGVMTGGVEGRGIQQGPMYGIGYNPPFNGRIFSGGGGEAPRYGPPSFGPASVHISQGQMPNNNMTNDKNAAIFQRPPSSSFVVGNNATTTSEKEYEFCQPNLNITYQSKSKQDEAIYEIYYSNPHKCHGTIVEISSEGDGKTFSSSYYFEYALHWDAIHIESNPDDFAKLVENRPHATNIFGAFCDGDSLSYYAGKFYASGSDSATIRRRGGVGNSDVELVTGIASEHYVTDSSPPERSITREVPCIHLGNALASSGVVKNNHIDVLYVSVGGDTISIFHTFPWSTLRVSVWVLDLNPTGQYYQTIHDKFLRNNYVKAEWDIKRWCPPENGRCMENEVWLERGFNPLVNINGHLPSQNRRQRRHRRLQQHDETAAVSMKVDESMVGQRLREIGAPRLYDPVTGRRINLRH